MICTLVTCGPWVSRKMFELLGSRDVAGEILGRDVDRAHAVAREQRGVVEVDVRIQHPPAIGERVGAVERDGHGLADQHGCCSTGSKLANMRMIELASAVPKNVGAVTFVMRSLNVGLIARHAGIARRDRGHRSHCPPSRRTRVAARCRR